MNAQIERNLERAERGGVPGTRGLVGAYLKVGVDDPNAEDGTIPHDGLPVWEVTYHCFRAGDLSAAKDALGILANFPQSAVLVACLNHLAKELKYVYFSNSFVLYFLVPKLCLTFSIQLKMPITCVYHRLDIDLKKKLKVEWRHNANSARDKYKRALYAALLGLDSPLVDTMENWLWFKLIALRIDPHTTAILYGELLFDCGHIADAVHVAILAHELGYLRNTTEASAGMVVVESPNLTKCSLNVARLLVAYTKEFELTDVGRALDYWFLLRVGWVLILVLPMSGICTFIIKSKIYSNSAEVVVRVLVICERWQRSSWQVILTLSFKILRFEISTLSDFLEDCYYNLFAAQRGCRSSDLSTLCILLDICTLFALCDAGQAEKALHVSQQLRLVPVDPDSVAIIVGEFHLVPQKVREVIPDLCLRLMRCMADAIHLVDRANVKFIKQVKAIILYIATVNYKCPQHINSKLLQLQASISI
uniref:Nuclear pore protein n=1 Tax=Heterorhabditis bacteriophora TaxID=37862 RepID=A0A1I7WS21_HETBA